MAGPGSGSAELAQALPAGGRWPLGCTGRGWALWGWGPWEEAGLMPVLPPWGSSRGLGAKAAAGGQTGERHVGWPSSLCPHLSACKGGRRAPGGPPSARWPARSRLTRPRVRAGPRLHDRPFVVLCHHRCSEGGMGPHRRSATYDWGLSGSFLLSGPLGFPRDGGETEDLKGIRRPSGTPRGVTKQTRRLRPDLGHTPAGKAGGSE